MVVTMISMPYNEKMPPKDQLIFSSPEVKIKWYKM